MGIGSGTAALIMGGLGAAGSIGSAAIGSSAAKSAASTQQQGAQQAAKLQQQEAQNATNYQNQIYGQTQQNLSPYIQAGGGALNRLQYLLGTGSNTSIGNPVQGATSVGDQQQQLPQTAQTGTGPGTYGRPTASAVGATSGLNSAALNPQAGFPATSAGSFGRPTANPVGAGGAIDNSNLGSSVQPSTGSAAPSSGGYGSLTSGYGQTFQAPTGLTEQNDPGYQARLALGQTAMEKSAAARGNILTGGTAQAENQAAQDYASNEYGNVYNRALNTFGTNYGVWNNDQNNIYSRLMGLSNAGQTAATSQGSLGQSAAGNVAGIDTSTGQQVGQDYGNAAAANASGVVGSANAWSGALGNTGNNLSNLLLLSQLQGGSGSGYQASNYGVPSGIGF